MLIGPIQQIDNSDIKDLSEEIRKLRLRVLGKYPSELGVSATR